MNIKNKTKFFFTIITINLNNFEGLKKTYQSVSAQTFKNYQHIIIDGKSNFGEIQLIRKIIKNNNRVLFVSEKDNGVYWAMNKAIKLSNSHFYIFLNSGDFFFDNLVLENFYSIYLDIEPKKRKKLILFGKAKIQGKYFTWNLPSENILKKKILPVHQAMCIPNKLLKKYNTSYRIASDEDFKFKMLFKKRLKYIPYIICIYSYYGLSNNDDFNLNFLRTKEQVKIRIKYRLYFSAIKIIAINCLKFFLSKFLKDYVLEYFAKKKYE